MDRKTETCLYSPIDNKKMKDRLFLAITKASDCILYTGYPLKLYFQIPCVFPVRPQIFPVPIYIMCEYYIHRTDLADLFSFWKKMDVFAATIVISFTFRIRTFTT